MTSEVSAFPKSAYVIYKVNMDFRTIEILACTGSGWWKAKRARLMITFLDDGRKWPKMGDSAGSL